MCDTNKTEQKRPRTLADIVREKTNDGDTIVQFYLDVANGKLDPLVKTRFEEVPAL